MKALHPDDPRLTAYALGELPPAEAAEIESLINEDPELRKFVEETRILAQALEKELLSDPVPELGVENLRAIDEALKKRKVVRFPIAVWTAGLAAACLAFLLVPAFLTSSGSVKDHEGVAGMTGLSTAPEEKLLAKDGSVSRQVEAQAASAPALLPERGGAFSGEVALQAPGTGMDRKKTDFRANRSLVVTNGTVAQLLAKNAKPTDGSGTIQLGQAPTSSGATTITGFKATTGLTRRESKIEASAGYARATPPAAVADAAYDQRMAAAEPNTEAYDSIKDNDFIKVVAGDKESSFSTFSIDVDTASYANVRRMLNDGELPPPGSVRLEELINYFRYNYPQPKDGDPFSVTTDVTTAPWNAKHRLVRIGLMGREIPAAERPACNLIFLLDVSGSMNEPNKLPLVKASLTKLVDQLRPQDRVAIVVYAGASGMVLPSTSAAQKNTIKRAIAELRPGGSTNGAAGIQLAYDIAKANFIEGGVNRVILATDGDFNVGVTSQDELVRLVEAKAKSNIFLTVTGFGMGNYKDSTLEKLADKGNGNYAYIDSLREADKVFVRQIGGTLVTIAKDVKIQVEFNPANVAAYRLVGYENRVMANRDFNDDTKDAGEIGSGHTVTALYEIVPAGSETDLPETDPLRYALAAATKAFTARNDELLLVKLRYKQPEGDTSTLLTFPVGTAFTPIDKAPADTRFAAAVAAFGMVLRDSPHKGTATFDMAESLAEGGLNRDTSGDRQEFLGLIRKAEALQKNR